MKLSLDLINLYRETVRSKNLKLLLSESLIIILKTNLNIECADNWVMLSQFTAHIYKSWWNPGTAWVFRFGGLLI